MENAGRRIAQRDAGARDECCRRGGVRRAARAQRGEGRRGNVRRDRGRGGFFWPAAGRVATGELVGGEVAPWLPLMRLLLPGTRKLRRRWPGFSRLADAAAVWRSVYDAAGAPGVPPPEAAAAVARHPVARGPKRPTFAPAADQPGDAAELERRRRGARGAPARRSVRGAAFDAPRCGRGGTRRRTARPRRRRGGRRATSARGGVRRAAGGSWCVRRASGPTPVSPEEPAAAAPAPRRPTPPRPPWRRPGGQASARRRPTPAAFDAPPAPPRGLRRRDRARRSPHGIHLRAGRGQPAAAAPRRPPDAAAAFAPAPEAAAFAPPGDAAAGRRAARRRGAAFGVPPIDPQLSPASDRQPGVWRTTDRRPAFGAPPADAAAAAFGAPPNAPARSRRRPRRRAGPTASAAARGFPPAPRPCPAACRRPSTSAAGRLFWVARPPRRRAPPQPEAFEPPPPAPPMPMPPSLSTGRLRGRRAGSHRRRWPRPRRLPRASASVVQRRHQQRRAVPLDALVAVLANAADATLPRNDDRRPAQFNRVLCDGGAAARLGALLLRRGRGRRRAPRGLPRARERSHVAGAPSCCNARAARSGRLRRGALRARAAAGGCAWARGTCRRPVLRGFGSPRPGRSRRSARATRATASRPPSRPAGAY